MIPADSTIAPWSPYRVEAFPRSNGRVLLGEALATYTLLQHGIGPMQIAEAFAPGGDERTRELVGTAVRFLGGLLVQGRFVTTARPIGGGEPVAMVHGQWELDDLVPRFATCALDLRHPFDAAAIPTHRIFMDEADLTALAEACCADVVPTSPQRASRKDPAHPEPMDGDRVLITSDPALDRRIRMPELEGLVGKKRNTIYARIKAGEFPEGELDGARIRYWRLSEVRAYLAG